MGYKLVLGPPACMDDLSEFQNFGDELNIFIVTHSESGHGFSHDHRSFQVAIQIWTSKPKKTRRR